MLDQGLSRGDVRASDAASPAGWVRQWAPSYAAGGAAALVRVTEAVAKPCNGLLAEAVLAARVPVRNAAVALTEMDELRPRLTPECHGTVLEGFVALAEAHGPREIRALRPALIAKYGRLGEFQRREDRLKHGTSLSQPYDDDGMAEYRLRLDPEGSAVLEAILGPLAAPQPSHRARLGHCGPATSGGPTRWSRSAAAPRPPAGPPRATAKAAVVVTMGYQDLLERTGAGTTLTGELLAPETVRKMACDAAIIPAVLGSRGEVLDLGRTVRLATPKQVQALWIRDQGLHLPRLLEAPILVRRTSRLALVRRRPDRPVEPGPALPEAPHDRAPEGLHRHRHRDRGDLAPVAAPPRDPPYETGRSGTPGGHEAPDGSRLDGP